MVTFFEEKNTEPVLGKMSREKFVFFGALSEKGGSGYARFFALSQEVHFRSIIGVYIFQNANIVNF